MSRTIKKQPKREEPRTLRPLGIKKTPSRKKAHNDYFDDEDELQL